MFPFIKKRSSMTLGTRPASNGGASQPPTPGSSNAPSKPPQQQSILPQRRPSSTPPLATTTTAAAPPPTSASTSSSTPAASTPPSAAQPAAKDTPSSATVTHKSFRRKDETVAAPPPPPAPVDDVLMGGALTTDDLFELLEMEMENLSNKSKSAEGITKADLRPLIKAIADLRSVGRGQDEAVRRAVEFQLKMIATVQALAEVDAALNSRNYEAMKLAYQKVKHYGLKSRRAKELERLLLTTEKEKVKEVEADNRRLRKELQDVSSSGQKKRSMLTRLTGRAAGEDEGEYEADDLLLADRPGGPLGRAVSAPPGSAQDGQQQQHQQGVEALPGGSSLAMAGVTREFVEQRNAVQYDLMVDAMRRVKDVMDNPALFAARGPAAFLQAAGQQMELVTGDVSAVHMWLGDFHALVKAGTGASAANSSTVVLGEVDSKSTGARWEVRVLKSRTSRVNPRTSASASTSPCSPGCRAALTTIRSWRWPPHSSCAPRPTTERTSRASSTTPRSSPRR